MVKYDAVKTSVKNILDPVKKKKNWSDPVEVQRKKCPGEFTKVNS